MTPSPMLALPRWARISRKTCRIVAATLAVLFAVRIAVGGIYDAIGRDLTWDSPSLGFVGAALFLALIVSALIWLAGEFVAGLYEDPPAGQSPIYGSVEGRGWSRPDGRPGSVKLALKLIGYNVGVLIFALLLLSALGGGFGYPELAIWFVLGVAGCVGVTVSALRSR